MVFIESLSCRFCINKRDEVAADCTLELFLDRWLFKEGEPAPRIARPRPGSAKVSQPPGSGAPPCPGRQHFLLETTFGTDRLSMDQQNAENCPWVWWVWGREKTFTPVFVARSQAADLQPTPRAGLWF